MDSLILNVKMAKGKKSSNVEEFANRSTIHGISYVFDRQIPLVIKSSGLWFLEYLVDLSAP